MTNNQATLDKLDRMRLHGMARALRTSLDTQGQWTADELLAHLVDAEWDDRHERRLKRLLKAARFRYPAAIEEVDFALRRNLDQNQLLRLADCRWVGQHQDLIISGKCGSGKSFLASALGHQACLRGFRVGYHASSRLFGELRLAKADGSYVRELDKISKQALLIIDDFGLEPLDALARLALLEMLEDRHGRASTLMVSQLPVSSWHEVIGEPTIADAICDRIVHPPQMPRYGALADAADHRVGLIIRQPHAGAGIAFHQLQQLHHQVQPDVALRDHEPRQHALGVLFALPFRLRTDQRHDHQFVVAPVRTAPQPLAPGIWMRGSCRLPHNRHGRCRAASVTVARYA